MGVTDIVIVLLAGFAASAVNALAGGGSLITFPTLVAIGLPPVSANVTNSLGVSPGYAASVVGSRLDLADIARRWGRRALLAMLPTVIAGTVVGCVLLLATPERTFELVVPFLVLGATAVLAFQGRLRSLVGRGRGLQRRGVGMHAVVLLASVYSGYFGAALGVMLVAALGLVLEESLRHVSALKNAVSAVSGFITVLVFAAFGPVDWVAVAVLVPATIAGGYVGARLVQRLPAGILRVLIVIIGTVVGAVLLLRAL
jgi:uncharacterized membrane protein YfcA